MKTYRDKLMESDIVWLKDEIVRQQNRTELAQHDLETMKGVLTKREKESHE